MTVEVVYLAVRRSTCLSHTWCSLCQRISPSPLSTPAISCLAERRGRGRRKTGGKGKGEKKVQYLPRTTLVRGDCRSREVAPQEVRPIIVFLIQLLPSILLLSYASMLLVTFLGRTRNATALEIGGFLGQSLEKLKTRRWPKKVWLFTCRRISSAFKKRYDHEAGFSALNVIL
jgi:hypothetical protein